MGIEFKIVYVKIDQYFGVSCPGAGLCIFFSILCKQLILGGGFGLVVFWTHLKGGL